MQRPSSGKVCGGNKEAMTIILVHEANHQVQITRRFEKMFEDGVIVRGSVGNGSDQILQNISR